MDYRVGLPPNFIIYIPWNDPSINTKDNSKHIKDTLKTEPGTIVQVHTNEVLIVCQNGQEVQKIFCSTKSSYL